MIIHSFRYQYIDHLNPKLFAKARRFPVTSSIRPGFFLNAEFQEDCSPAGRLTKCFGHRRAAPGESNDNAAFDKYDWPAVVGTDDRKFGCRYNAVDTPGAGGIDAVLAGAKRIGDKAIIDMDFNWTFLLNMIDVCSNTVRESIILDVDCRMRLTPATLGL